MGTLPQKQINSASGIYNFIRNLTPANPQVQRAGSALQKLIAIHAGPAKAHLRTAAMLNTGLNNQAQLWAYVGVFRYVAIVCAIAVPLAFVRKKARSSAGPAERVFLANQPDSSPSTLT